MNIVDMHVMFRQYAQQMGMQNVRAILPEQIDLVLNTSISDTINQIVASSVNVTNDRIITDNSKIAQINALRTLYTVKEIDCIRKDTENIPFRFIKENYFNGKLISSKDYFNAFDALYWVDFSINYCKSSIGLEGVYEHSEIFVTSNTGGLSTIIVKSDNNELFSFEVTDSQDEEYVTDQLISHFTDLGFQIVDADDTAFGLIAIDDKYPYITIESTNDVYEFEINNLNELTGIKSGVNPFVTNYFPVRLIDDTFLADSLNDFILKNRLRSPILTIHSNNTFELYIDKFIPNNTGTQYTLNNRLIPYKFRIAYIAKPAKVQYSEDVSGTNVNCNLPEYLHENIVKHAVDLYRIAISGSLYANQEQQKNQNREDYRNNARQDN